MSEEIIAYDQDTGINASLRYSIDSNPGNFFDIIPNDGRIFLKNRIPKGFKNGYSLIVKAKQANNQEKTNLATVNINIININEHVPIFDKDYYEASVREDAYFNAPILTVHACDDDDNQLEYFMVTNNDNPFVIEAKTGLIKLNRKLDYETKSVYTIEVAAKDDKHTSTVFVKIKVINIVDRAPHFEQIYYNFKVKSPNDVYLGQVRAINIENSGQINYSLDFINANDSSLFCISKTAVIYICPQKKTQLYAVGANSETISGNIFEKNEYVFFIQASIRVDNETNDELVSKVECRIQVEFKVLAEGPNIAISGREIIFKDPNTFYAFLAALSGITIVMVISIIIMVWYKCQKNKHVLQSLYKNRSSSNTITSSSGRSNHSSVNTSYLGNTKKNTTTTLNTAIINQWEEKGINGIFYGNDTNNNDSKVETPIETKLGVDGIDSQIKSGFDICKTAVGMESDKSISIYSINRCKSNKSISRSLSSASSTSIPITSLSSSRTRTPSFSSVGISLAVDNTISEEYSYPKEEPLTIQYETSMNYLQEETPSVFKSEFVLPNMSYTTIPNCKYDEQTANISFDVDEVSNCSSNNNKYQKVTQKLSQILQQKAQIINELSKQNLNTFCKTHMLSATTNCTTNSLISTSSNNTLIDREFFFGHDN